LHKGLGFYNWMFLFLKLSIYLQYLLLTVVFPFFALIFFKSLFTFSVLFPNHYLISLVSRSLLSILDIQNGHWLKLCHITLFSKLYQYIYIGKCKMLQLLCVGLAVNRSIGLVCKYRKNKNSSIKIIPLQNMSKSAQVYGV